MVLMTSTKMQELIDALKSSPMKASALIRSCAKELPEMGREVHGRLKGLAPLDPLDWTRVLTETFNVHEALIELINFLSVLPRDDGK
jgi:hypothetical protein